MSTQKENTSTLVIALVCVLILSSVLFVFIEIIPHARVYTLWITLSLFLLFLLVWAATVVGKMAKRYGRSYWSWFWVSLLLLWPFWAILLLCALGKTDEKKRKDIEEDEIIRIKIRKKYESRGETPLST
jgi:energy-coupling factor transporter transmembrane protein EcfT